MNLTDLQKDSIGFIKKLQSHLRRNSLDAFFVADIPNVRYLTTFSGTSGYCLVLRDSAFFLTDSRYKIQASQQVASCETVIYAGNVFDFMKKKFFRLTSSRHTSIGIEDSLPVGLLADAESRLNGCKFVRTSQVIEKLAAVKTRAEVERIMKACAISGSALDVLVQEDWVGQTETGLSAMLEFNQKMLGASKESFDTIVASGRRGSMPHGVASAKDIARGEFVTIDFGCFYDGYASDITRTFQTGAEIRPELKKVYDVVHDAQQKAVDSARAGVEAAKVDKAARDYIEKKGYGKFFGHGTGHGLGLRIHELPRVSKISEDVLVEGNVITIEPGIYIPRLGGVRIEDDFLVKKEGVVQLSHFSKEADYYISAYDRS